MVRKQKMKTETLKLIKLKLRQLSEMNSILPLILDGTRTYDKLSKEIKERYEQEERELLK